MNEEAYACTVSGEFSVSLGAAVCLSCGWWLSSGGGNGVADDARSFNNFIIYFNLIFSIMRRGASFFFINVC